VLLSLARLHAQSARKYKSVAATSATEMLPPVGRSDLLVPAAVCSPEIVLVVLLLTDVVADVMVVVVEVTSVVLVVVTLVVVTLVVVTLVVVTLVVVLLPVVVLMVVLEVVVVVVVDVRKVQFPSRCEANGCTWSGGHGKQLRCAAPSGT
jgi:hypothetical protein